MQTFGLSCKLQAASYKKNPVGVYLVAGSLFSCRWIIGSNLSSKPKADTGLFFGLLLEA
nr:hypothetical protein [uncultured Pseudomonas sp.]